MVPCLRTNINVEDLVEFVKRSAELIQSGAEEAMRHDLFEALRIACRNPACAAIFGQDKVIFLHRTCLKFV